MRATAYKRRRANDVVVDEDGPRVIRRRTDRVATISQVNRIIARKSDHKNTIYTNDTTINYNGTVFPLMGNMSQGDGLTNNYNGQFVQPVNVHVRGIIAAGDAANTMRVILFQWLEDGIPVGASILANLATSNAPNSAWLWENRPFMKILRDTGPIFLQNGAPATQTNGGNGWGTQFNLFTKSKLRRTYFSNTTGVVKKGGLYLLVVSDSAAVPNCGVTFTSQIVYTDGL